MRHGPASYRASLTLVLLASFGDACNKDGGAGSTTTSSGGSASGGMAASTAATGGVGGSPVASSGGATGSGGGRDDAGAAGSDAPTPVGSGGAPGPVDAADAPPLVEAFAAMAREIAVDYPAWGRVDDELRWAPWLCRIPLPGIARPSESNDAATHGRKLYSVFAKNHDAYPAGDQTGQIVVKQSWTAELVTTPGEVFAPASAMFAPDAGDHFYGYAQGDGGVYRAADLAGLYIMFKLDPSTPDTDDGWVYATVTADGQVTAAGRVSSCMNCHEVATHERLFGVPLSPTLPN